MDRSKLRAVGAGVLLAISLTAPAHAGLIVITAVEGFPNGRTSNDIPANAIDGDTNTWTWTTESNNTATPSYLAIGFASTQVDRIRVWKDPAGGGGNNSKNIFIQYTTDLGVLDSRTYTTVTNLTNGYNGSELWSGSVNSNGTVAADVQNSGGDVTWWNIPGTGWASLTFDPVTATGIRIGFSNPAPLYNFCNGVTIDQTCNHYRVAEFQARFDPVGVPEPATLALVGLGLAGLGFSRRKQ